jgi:hypothetical protein
MGFYDSYDAQKLREIEELKAENAKLREALSHAEGLLCAAGVKEEPGNGVCPQCKYRGLGPKGGGCHICRWPY